MNGREHSGPEWVVEPVVGEWSPTDDGPQGSARWPEPWLGQGVGYDQTDAEWLATRAYRVGGS